MEGGHPWPGERAYWRSVWQGWLGSEQKKVNLEKGAEAHEVDLQVGDELAHVDLQDGAELHQDNIEEEAVQRQVDL